MNADAPKSKRRRINPPPEGDFARGHLLWLPNQLEVVKQFSFTVPHKPPLLNDILTLRAAQAGRYGHHQYTAFKDAWEAVVRHYWVTSSWIHGSPPPKVLEAYNVRYLYMLGDRKADLSGFHAAFEKVLLDALVQGGALPGDSLRHHQGGSYGWQWTPGKWGVLVTVTQVEMPPGFTDQRKAVGRFRTRRRKARPPRSTT